MILSIKIDWESSADLIKTEAALVTDLASAETALPGWA